MPAMISVCCLFLCLCIHFIFGCSSSFTSQTDDSADTNHAVEKEQAKPKANLKEENDTIINWQNKGFGAPSPVWFINALSGNFAALRSHYPAAALQTMIIVHSDDSDLDLAESRLSEYDIQTKIPTASDIQTLDSSWIQIHPAEKKQLPDFYKAMQLYAANDTRQTEPVVLIVPAED